MSYSKICLIWFVGFAFLFFIVFGYPPTSRQYIYSFEQKDEEYVFFCKGRRWWNGLYKKRNGFCKSLLHIRNGGTTVS